MASANLSAYNAALKQTWTEDRLYEQIFQGDDLLSDIEKTTRYQVGKQAVTPIHTSRNGGYTTLPAGGGNLNTAGNQGSAQATWNYTHHHQQIAVEGELIDGTAANALSVANGVDTEVTGGLTDLRRQLVRQIATDGTGVISVCGATAASSTVVLKQTNSINNAVERGWLFKGAQVDVGTAAAPTTRVAGATVSAVDDSAFTITIGSAITTTADVDQVAYKGSRGAGTVNEMNGLLTLIGTSTLGGVNPATESVWKSQVDATAQAITLPLIYAIPRKVRQRSGQLPDTLLTSYKQEENVYKQLQTQVRYAGEGNLSTGNRDAVKIGGMNLRSEFDIQNEHMLAFKKSDFFICAAGKPYWVNKVTGGEILQWIQGTDSYGSKITYRIQLCARRRNTAFAYTGLN